ncbi:MAG TPA: hypothetical protein VER32_11005 [Pyrinomonadaceae bacterium]|nr:hypothetical protein [Pyrinomonadaceae bacterium]
MYDTSGTYSVCDGRAFDPRHTHARLTWLAQEVGGGERRPLPVRRDDYEQGLLVARPVAPREAFALFGALLGLLPPAAIFTRTFGFGAGLEQDWGRYSFFLLCLTMNVVCVLFGRAMGARLAARFDALRSRSWLYTVAAAALLGAAWGFATGSLGGFVFFGFGAFFGAACAIPVGAVAFAVFAPLHRLVARGGMIDARQLRPLALGVAATVAAVILGL